MKLTLLTLVLAASAALCSLCANPPSPSSLRLEVKPERHAVQSESSDIAVQISVTGAKVTAKERVPINLAIVLDRSGSMSGAKLEKAKQAACMAVEQLSSKDRVAVIIYDNEAEVLVPSQPASNPDAIKAKISRIETGGGTGLYAGVKLGGEQLDENLKKMKVNRVLLLSDGLANEGPSTPRDLANLGKRLLADGITTSTIGLGDDYNEDLMVALAEAGGANYYYVKDTEKLPEIFLSELGELKSIVARNVKIVITCPEGVTPVEIIGHPEVIFKGQSAVIVLSGIYSEQNRYFFLRCQSGQKRESSDVVQVKMVYDDESTGSSRNLDASAKVTFTGSTVESEKSIEPEVAKKLAITRNSLAKDEAIRLADAGKPKEAAEVLSKQASVNSGLPAAAKSDQLDIENKKLETRSAELKSSGSFSKSSRKEVQYENFQDKYQKR